MFLYNFLIEKGLGGASDFRQFSDDEHQYNTYIISFPCKLGIRHHVVTFAICLDHSPSFYTTCQTGSYASVKASQRIRFVSECSAGHLWSLNLCFNLRHAGFGRPTSAPWRPSVWQRSRSSTTASIHMLHALTSSGTIHLWWYVPT